MKSEHDGSIFKAELWFLFDKIKNTCYAGHLIYDRYPIMECFVVQWWSLVNWEEESDSVETTTRSLLIPGSLNSVGETVYVTKNNTQSVMKFTDTSHSPLTTPKLLT